MSDFETRLRLELEAAADLAPSDRGWSSVPQRARARDRRRLQAALLGVALVVGGAALAVPRWGANVQFGADAAEVSSDPMPTQTASGVAAVASDLVTGSRPTGRLLVSAGADLRVTDLDGADLQVPAWQPMQSGVIRDLAIAPDGASVVVWHAPCGLEAGSLVEGVGLLMPPELEGVSQDHHCDGPAVFAPDGTAVAWTSGVGEEAHVYAAAWGTAGADPSTVVRLTADPLAGTSRLVGWESAAEGNPAGGGRLLIRQRLANWTEVLAMDLHGQSDDVQTLRGGEFAPAFVHHDGRVPVDAADGLVLELGWTLPDGDAGYGEPVDLAVRAPGGGSFGSSQIVEPDTVWFDAEEGVWVLGPYAEEGSAVWMRLENGLAWGPYPIAGEVTAAGVLPGSITTAPSPTVSRTPTVAPTATESLTPEGSAVWCRDVLVAVVTTTAGGVEALCRDGSTHPIETDGFARKVTIGGTDLVLHRLRSADEGPVEMLAIDLATGAQRMLGEGYLPALSPAGRLAWLSAEPGQTLLRIAERAGDEPSLEVGLPDGPVVQGVSWDRSGRWVILDRGEIGGPHAISALDTGASPPDWVPIEPSTRVIAVAGETDTPDVVVVLSIRGSEELVISGAILAEEDRVLPAPRITIVDSLPIWPTSPVGDVDFGFWPHIEPLGLRTYDGRWLDGQSISWLIGDGDNLWAVTDGTATFVRADVTDVAVNPNTERSEPAESTTSSTGLAPNTPPTTRPGTSAEEALARAFLRFARDPSEMTLEATPFANEVRLGLGPTIERVEERAGVVDPGRWVFPNEQSFRASAGPLSVLEFARRTADVVVTVGEHPHCASPPVPAPGDVRDLRRVSVQPNPDSISSCLEWWTIDLFVTPDDVIAAVTLDFWEP